MQNNIISTSSKKFSVTFNIGFDSQFFKQTTTDGLYDVYTIVGQSGTDGLSLTEWADKSVIATFTTNIPKIIQYVCVGGGGYTYGISTGTAYNGGGGAGAYYEGSLIINSNIVLTLTAGGSYRTSTITSTPLNITAGYGGYSIRWNVSSGRENGNNGSSGGGGVGAGTGNPPGTGSLPGNNGGNAFDGIGAVRAGGGGGGAGGQGGNASSGVGGAGGIGKTPSGVGINNIYTTPLCVGGQGRRSIGATSLTYGSGADGQLNNSVYYYGKPGAIIIAVPKT